MEPSIIGAWWPELLARWPELLAIMLCLLGSAFFSSAETALTSISEAKVHQILDSGAKGSHRLRLWLEKPNHLLTTILIGNNLVNIMASALATHVAGNIFQSSGLGVAIGLMTFLLLVFGEITPKTYAKHNAERVAVAAMRLLRLFFLLFYPVIYALVILSRFVLRLSGGNADSPESSVTEKDIEFLIDLGQKEGVLEAHEEQMLHSVLELSDTVSREVMVPRTNMLAIDINVDRESVLKTIIEGGFTRVPVYDGSVDNIVGLIHVKDLLKYLEPEYRSSFVLKEILRPVYYVPESMRISNLLQEFRRRKTHLAVVVDEYGGTAGIVAMEDIIEEIVGEIQDEHDIEEKQLKKLTEGRYLADARISVDDLGDFLDIEFPEEDSYETLGGFLTALEGRLPLPGQRQEFGDYVFVIREADEKRVLKVEIIPKGSAIDAIAANLTESQVTGKLEREGLIKKTLASG